MVRITTIPRCGAFVTPQLSVHQASIMTCIFVHRAGLYIVMIASEGFVRGELGSRAERGNDIPAHDREADSAKRSQPSVIAAGVYQSKSELSKSAPMRPQFASDAAMETADMLSGRTSWQNFRGSSGIRAQRLPSLDKMLTFGLP